MGEYRTTLAILKAQTYLRQGTVFGVPARDILFSGEVWSGDISPFGEGLDGIDPVRRSDAADGEIQSAQKDLL